MNNCFQKLLWNISGAELPILEKCQTDHKKFSAIGNTTTAAVFILQRENLEIVQLTKDAELTKLGDACSESNDPLVAIYGVSPIQYIIPKEPSSLS